MRAEQIAEYVGLTPEAIGLIERCRTMPDETRSDIIVRALSPIVGPITPRPDGLFDLGQGAHLAVGEKPILFLSEDAKRRNKPDAIAEIRSDGFYLEGRKIEPSKGSVLQPAMRIIQERKGHRNSRGELISLSAWRQWHVVRNGQLRSMLELKNPELAHRRGRRELTLEDLEDLEL